MASGWKYIERSNDMYGEKNGPRGRLRKRWKDSVKELSEEIRADWEQAYDRERWKGVVLGAKSLNGS